MRAALARPFRAGGAAAARDLDQGIAHATSGPDAEARRSPGRSWPCPWSASSRIRARRGRGRGCWRRGSMTAGNPLSLQTSASDWPRRPAECGRDLPVSCRAEPIRAAAALADRRLAGGGFGSGRRRRRRWAAGADSTGVEAAAESPARLWRPLRASRLWRLRAHIGFRGHGCRLGLRRAASGRPSVEVGAAGVEAAATSADRRVLPDHVAHGESHGRTAAPR